MNFKKLFETQAALDAAIFEKHQELKGQDNLDWKVLALQVELGECANEWRGFKKWSTNQQPRTHKVVRCHACGGQGFFLGFQNTQENCGYCEGAGIQEETNPLLEEYVDVLHFALSIGLEINTQVESVYLLDKYKHSITQQFSGLMIAVGLLAVQNEESRIESYQNVFAGIIRLGLKLGFTLEQIEEAYYSKNKINHERQQSGY